MGDALAAKGYAAALEADWTVLSRTADPTAPQEYAAELWPMVRNLVADLPMEAGDRVDLHWIGHRRGAVVVSEALSLAQADPELPETIRGGWQQVTLLDPHPARNSRPEQMSINRLNPLGVIIGNFTRVFQSKAMDPDVVLPSMFVDYADLYYQRNEWYALSRTEVYFDFLVNYWGETLPDQAIDERVDVTQPKLSHFEVPNYYIDEVLADADAPESLLLTQQPPVRRSAKPRR
jgi:hypothetical protein